MRKDLENKSRCGIFASQHMDDEPQFNHSFLTISHPEGTLLCSSKSVCCTPKGGDFNFSVMQHTAKARSAQRPITQRLLADCIREIQLLRWFKSLNTGVSVPGKFQSDTLSVVIEIHGLPPEDRYFDMFHDLLPEKIESIYDTAYHIDLEYQLQKIIIS